VSDKLHLAVRHDVALVPFLLEGVALNPEFNGTDGIHPNAAGARRIADTVWTYLAPLVASMASGSRSRRRGASPSRSCRYQAARQTDAAVPRTSRLSS
jgi:hypothetical protein